jgi:Fe-S cluster assembly protein SufD
MEKIVEKYIEAFERMKDAATEEPSWLRSMRDEALERFTEKGFPTVKDEAWRYTDISGAVDGGFFPKAGAPEITAERVRALKEGVGGYGLCVMNGKYCPELSDIPAAVRVRNIPDILEEDEGSLRILRAMLMEKLDALSGLNMALGLEGVFLEVPDGVHLERPLHLIYQTDLRGGLCLPKTVVTLGKGAKAVLIEDFHGGDHGNYFTNAVTGAVLGEGAVLEHYKIQREGRDAVHVAHLNVEQSARSSFTSLSVAAGAKLSRHEISVEFKGDGAACRLSGIYLGAGDQHFDHVTWVDHAAPSCKSDQLFKGILGGSARGVFTGRVLVRPGAQKTDARQTNRSLLLSGTAKADARPQLEILADDVKCSHGAAVGQLEEDAVFYLRSRGIGEREAQKILAEGFAHEILDPVAAGPFREMLRALISEKLQKQFC